jgi:hypothetical protein
LKGDKNWLEEGFLVPTKKIKKKLINNHGRIPMPPPNEGIMSKESMGEWGSHATTSSTIPVPHEVFMALHPTKARRRDHKHFLSNWLPSQLD